MENGKEHGNYCLGLRNNGQENGNYYGIVGYILGAKLLHSNRVKMGGGVHWG